MTRRLSEEQVKACRRMMDALDAGETLPWADASHALERAPGKDKRNEYSAAWLLTNYLLDLQDEMRIAAVEIQAWREGDDDFWFTKGIFNEFGERIGKARAATDASGFMESVKEVDS